MKRATYAAHERHKKAHKAAEIAQKAANQAFRNSNEAEKAAEEAEKKFAATVCTYEQALERGMRRWIRPESDRARRWGKLLPKMSNTDDSATAGYVSCMFELASHETCRC